ncbi:hypothetical protein WH50_07290 [Pokkaliibacter plantistimulans]|uniref:Phosphohistidine phosphatase n=1 Tax=Pokkaliibacter plantistimulans TaxID=1635171 RepID=A0ABX5LYZ2_9GAMM|nr:histidine phosphatase family protein [Pokkaliibacter plantistimulans]PXF31900.1 hypothetical protein WH50_07290 [Pokkaliibacter plantistimulans]
MKLIVMRHGEAEQWANSDAERQLTLRGQKDNTQVLTALLARHSPSLLCASPFVRAQQTAQRCSEMCKLPIITSSLLVPDAPVHSTLDWLRDVLAEQQVVMLVAHMPLVGELLGWLLGAESELLGTSEVRVVNMDVVEYGCAMAEGRWIAVR